MKINVGVTLVELLVSISIISILITLSAPMFSRCIARAGVDEASQAIILALRYARYHAVIRNHVVVICRTTDEKYCNNKVEWNNGWMIFEDIDLNNKCKSKDGVFCADGGKILSIRNSFVDSGVIVKKNNSTRNIMKFNQYGETPGYPCKFTICDQYDRAEPKGVVISMIGRVRKNSQDDKLVCK